MKHRRTTEGYLLTLLALILFIPIGIILFFYDKTPWQKKKFKLMLSEIISILEKEHKVLTTVLSKNVRTNTGINSIRIFNCLMLKLIHENKVMVVKQFDIDSKRLRGYYTLINDGGFKKDHLQPSLFDTFQGFWDGILSPI